MLEQQNVIIFSSDDWSSGLKSSKYHVAVGLSRHNRVLFVNSIGLRNPSASARDLKRIWHKLASFFRGYQTINPNLFVFTPIVVPFHGSRWARALNRWILVASLRVLQWVLRLPRPVLLVFSPNFHEVLGQLGESATVYYCIDELKGYREVDSRMFDAMERSLQQKSDCIVACSQELVDKKRAVHPHVYYLPHGVDWALFRQTLDRDEPLPADIAQLPRPIIGFYGFISDDWIDFELLNEMARAHPEWSIVLIGRTKQDLGTVLRHPNIHFLGVRPFESLPGYNRGFDVALIPFALNELTVSSNPLKLYEYLASGLPVVSVDIPEVARHPELARVARDQREFIAMTEQALLENSPAQKLARSEAVRNETWANRLEQLSQIIERHRAPAQR